MVVFGDGAQALFHVWLHLRYFTSITNVTVVVGLHRTLLPEEVSRKEAKFQSDLVHLMNSEKQLRFKVSMINAKTEASQVNSVLANADIICTCTPSTTPVFEYSAIEGGRRRHICAVGSYKPTMCELPPEVVRSASESGRLMVDSKEACAHEAGCLIQAGLDAETGSLELGTSLPDPTEGNGEGYLERLERQAWKEAGVSVFKSVGVGLQDVEVTKLVVGLADGLGVEVPF